MTSSKPEEMLFADERLTARLKTGSDPGANSSQNEQDNKHFAVIAYIPILEPATPRETYKMFRFYFSLCFFLISRSA